MVIFSFRYTSKLIEKTIMKNPIMLEIQKYAKICDKTIDIEKSYNKMRKIRKFDKNLIVFNNDNNSKKNNIVSIVLETLDISYISDILNILKEKNIKITFFIKKDLFDNNINLIKKILLSGNDVELLSDKYSIYEINKYNSVLRLISDDKLSFCLINEIDNKIINNCKESHLIPIISTIDGRESLYYVVKDEIKDGAIIRIINNNKVVKELSATINYLKQKGKNIVTLNNYYSE
jgi:hypothetical protein